MKAYLMFLLVACGGAPEGTPELSPQPVAEAGADTFDPNLYVDMVPRGHGPAIQPMICPSEGTSCASPSPFEYQCADRERFWMCRAGTWRRVFCSLDPGVSGNCDGPNCDGQVVCP
jgi:hypothetical protein